MNGAKGGPIRLGPSLAGAAVFFAVTSLATGVAKATTLELHDEVRGAEVAEAEVRPRGAGSWRTVSWDALEDESLAPGAYQVRVQLDVGATGQSVQVPACAGRQRVTIDGREALAGPGPVVVPVGPGRHEVMVTVAVSAYERRIACGERPRIGAATRGIEGLGLLRFDSPRHGPDAGSAVLYVPPGHDVRRAATLLVGLHPWNGSIWTYAAYAGLLREADARDMLLLFPSGLGNSLYTADAEDEVMRAIDAAAGAVSVEARAVSLWGASMGGAGATTVGLHHPDRFASITSFFGDSRYDLATYVRALLPDERAAHRVNALDVVDNARHVPIWLVHGEADRTSPIRQSEILARALAQRGFAVRFDHIAGEGHSGALVGRYLPGVVAAAASARVPASVSRVTYRSVRPEDTGAYGIRLERGDGRSSPEPGRDVDVADAFVDVEALADAVHVHAEGVRELELARGALGTDPEHPPPIVLDGKSGRLAVHWSAGAAR
jgi:pimeloyl-ACP methyl ester carboxylesterase